LQTNSAHAQTAISAHADIQHPHTHCCRINCTCGLERVRCATHSASGRHDRHLHHGELTQASAHPLLPHRLHVQTRTGSLRHTQCERGVTKDAFIMANSLTAADTNTDAQLDVRRAFAVSLQFEPSRTRRQRRQQHGVLPRWQRLQGQCSHRFVPPGSTGERVGRAGGRQRRLRRVEAVVRLRRRRARAVVRCRR
jgi:hypothetical protein